MPRPRAPDRGDPLAGGPEVGEGTAKPRGVQHVDPAPANLSNLNRHRTRGVNKKAKPIGLQRIIVGPKNGGSHLPFDKFDASYTVSNAAELRIPPLGIANAFDTNAIHNGKSPRVP